MTCVKCRGELLASAPGPMKATIKGETVDFVADVQRCAQCGTVVVFGKALDQVNRRAADAYRVRHSLMTASDLVAAKKRLGLSWAKFADFIGVSLVQLKRWLAGAIQSAPMDQLIRFKTDLVALEKHAAVLRSLENRPSVTISVPVGTFNIGMGQPAAFTLQSSLVLGHEGDRSGRMNEHIFIGDAADSTALDWLHNAEYRTTTAEVAADNQYAVAA